MNKIKEAKGLFFFFRVNVLCEFVNIALPTSLSGEAIRIFKIKKNESIINSTKSIIYDRVVGLISLLMVAIFFSPILVAKAYEKIIVLDDKLLIGGSLFLAGAFILFVIQKIIKQFNFYKLFEFKFDKIYILFFLSVAGHLFFSFGYYLLLYSVSYLPYIYVSSIVFVSHITRIIPISVIGVGLSEASLVFLGASMGVDSSDFIVVIAVSLAITYFYSICVFIIELLTEGSGILFQIKNNNDIKKYDLYVR